jgi:MATE family multidrug resistance protein
VGQLGVIIQGMADTIMVGQYGTPELSASALVNNIYNFIIFFLLGISYATTPITGGAFGKGDHNEVSRSLKESLSVNLIFSGIIMILLTWLYFHLDILGQPQHLMPLVRPYYLVLMLSLPFLAGFNALKQFAEAVGHTTLPMRVMIVSNILNIALNALLIYGIVGMPEWGLFGAGMATFIARIFLFAAMMFAVFHGKRFKLWTRKSQHSSTTRKGCTHMAMVGFPIAIQLCLESASFNIAGMFMGWIGDIQLAAHQVMCSISTLIFMIQYGIGAAAAIRISQFRGRGEWIDVKRTVHSAWALAILFAIVSVGAIALFCQPITAIFTSDIRVQNMCFMLLPAFVLYQLGDCTQIIFSNSLRAIEAVGRMLLYAIISYLLVSIPMSYLLGIHLAFGAEGVWYGIPLGLTTAALLFMFEFRRKTKQLI